MLRRETSEFIAHDMWSPNSLDLNPVDYGIWGVIQERVRLPHANTGRDVAAQVDEHVGWFPPGM